MSWRVVFSRQALKDLELLRPVGLLPRAQELVALLAVDPLHTPPPCEKLRGDLAGKYSRRINRQHRLVYELDDEARAVRVLRMWTHYE